MKIYEVLNDALGKIYDDLPSHYADRDSAIWDALQELTDKYKQVEDVAIDYTKRATKFAYLFKYAGSRACAVYSRYSVKKLLENFAVGSLKVTSFGAGPGSDFLGVLRRYVENNSRFDLEVNLVDLDATWEPTAKVVIEAACNHLNGCPAPTVRFFELNCSSENVASGLAQFKESDLFTMSYLLSELSQDSAKRFLNALVSIAKQGAIIVVIDNNTAPVKAFLNELVQNQAVTHSGVKTEAIKLEYESVGDMGGHYEKFGDHERNGHPHIVLDAACIAAKKT